MIEYCIDKDGVISGASKEDLEILKERMLAKIKDEIELLCSVTFALGKEETPAVNVASPWGMSLWDDGDNMKAKCWSPPLVQHFVTDSPAEYRRKMNTPWADPRAGRAFLNRDRNDMLKGLQELLSEPGIVFMPFPADADEVEFDEASAYEEHLDDSSQRNFCKDINLDEMYTKGMKAYTTHPRGLNSLLSGDPGVTFVAI